MGKGPFKKLEAYKSSKYLCILYKLPFSVSKTFGPTANPAKSDVFTDIHMAIICTTVNIKCQYHIKKRTDDCTDSKERLKCKYMKTV